MNPSGAKQRLVAIDVGEVSLVDHPANEEPWVVTKAIAPEGSVTTVTKTEDGSMQLDPYTATSATLDAMQNVMWRLREKLTDPGKLAEAKQEIERIQTMIDKVSEFNSLVTKATTDLKSIVTKATAEADPKAGKGKKVPAFMKEAMKSMVESLKAMMEEDDGGENDGDEATTKAVAVILKAGKAQFSKERMGKMHEAFKHIGSLLKEADEDSFKKAISQWDAKPATAQTGGSANSPGSGPNTSGPNMDEPKPADNANNSLSANKAGEGAAGAQASGAPAWFDKAIDNLKKDISGQVTEQVSKAVGDVTKRVEAVEKTEAVSKSLTQGTDGKPVEKANSIWKGIL